MKELTKEILEILEKNNNQPGAVPSELVDLLHRSIPPVDTKNLRAKLYIYEYDLDGIPPCKHCGKREVQFNRGFKGFRNYCSKPCADAAMKGELGKARAQLANITKINVQIDCEAGEEEEFLKSMFRADGHLDGTRSTRITPEGIFHKWLKHTYPKISDESPNLMLTHITHDISEPKFCNNCGSRLADLARDYCSTLCSNSAIEKIEKTKQLNLERIGYTTNLELPSLIERNKVLIKQRCEQYRINFFHEESKNKSIVSDLCKSHSLTELSERWQMPYNTVRVVLQEYGLRALSIKSLPEVQISNYIRSLGFKATTNDRKIIYPKEIDIAIHKKKIGIEYNGVYYHSESKNRIFDPDAHINKTEMMESIGWTLIHICEKDWVDPIKRDIIKSMLSHKLGATKNKIYARSCNIEGVVDSSEARIFLNENHIQGHASSSIRYGLYHGGELVALMTFGVPRFNKGYDLELIRYATKKNTSIVGGFSRLLNLAPKNKSIISYAKRDYSCGNLYESCGFELIDTSRPNYFYWKYKNGIKTYSRYECQKHKLENLLEDFDPLKTEKQNMLDNGYSQYWDSGNLIYRRVIE